ncbi:hypothetical protein [Crenothrix polyspora]|uniref:Abortive infection protein-like C-terminal domain-containing protein n=1 Tax=Crenothrix polyspora TaxID=360316 RepID=A0A1R4HFE1_9GAMM|nr:hypothetical protein [Crenothrix polyspora]SJM94944.1 conserved hypothetical protein [Crenothrix polyspora]
MNNYDINSAWNAVAPILEKFRYYDIKNIVKLAGFNTKIIKSLGFDDWRQQNTGTDQLVSEIEEHFINFADEIKPRFLNMVIEEILSGRYNSYSGSDDNLEETLQYYLNRLGWQLIDNKVLPIEILDLSDLNELDTSAREDLVKAATKFRDGDLSGAISSACAAVDGATARVYKDKDLGDPNKSQSFQERCNKSLKAIGIFEAIDKQLIEIQWKEPDINQFKENLKKSLSQAAYVMQALRSNMSDVHGTKPVIKPLVFDSIKWSQIIVRLLSEKYDP